MRPILYFAILFMTCSLPVSGQNLDQIINSPLRPSYDSAQMAYRNGDFHRAIALYSDVINKTDSSSAFELNIRKKALIYRSFCKKALADFDGSLIDITRAIFIDPKDLASYIDRGTIYLEMGDIQKAKEDFLLILEKGPKSEQAQGGYYYLGLIFCKESKIPEGVEYLSKAIKIDPNDIEALFSRGYYYGLLFDSKNAIKDYDKIIKLDPSIKEVYANRGTEKVNLYNREGQKDKKLLSSACEDLRKAKQMGDNSVEDLLFIHCK